MKMADSNNTNTKSSSTASSNIDLQQTFDIAIDNSSEIDFFIQEKLREWNLSDYIEIFKRE